jgi:hypothetical protein
LFNATLQQVSQQGKNGKNTGSPMVGKFYARMNGAGIAHERIVAPVAVIGLTQSIESVPKQQRLNITVANGKAIMISIDANQRQD